MEIQALTHNKIDPAEIKPENIWANYDESSDTLLMYITGKPVPSSVEWQDDYMGILLDDDDVVVGFQIDHFENVWLPAHNEIARAWTKTKRTLLNEGWSNLLRILAAFIVTFTMTFNQDETAALTPA